MVLSLDDWEKQWNEYPLKVLKPTLVQVDFRGQLTGPQSTATETPVAAVACHC